MTLAGVNAQNNLSTANVILMMFIRSFSAIIDILFLIKNKMFNFQDWCSVLARNFTLRLINVAGWIQNIVVLRNNLRCRRGHNVRR